MPTYDFRCPQGHDFERFYRKISDAPMETPCPECGQTAQRRLSAGAGLLFKGSGFYLTDYGKNAHRKSATDTKPGEGKSGDSGSSESKSSSGESASKPSTTESKSETKPATPAPKKSTGSGEG
jgi:putative FmdB family regulatory protein